MHVTTEAITGDETDVKGVSPYSTLVDFYHAFNHQDMDRMAANWLQSDAASMSNPLGGIKRGWAEIEQVYKRIFLGVARVYVEFYDYSIHESGGMFVAVGRERGTLTIRNETIDLAIRTSRTYCNEGGCWRQLHHHGSMDDAALLAKYQRTLTGK